MNLRAATTDLRDGCYKQKYYKKMFFQEYRQKIGIDRVDIYQRVAKAQIL